MFKSEITAKKRHYEKTVQEVTELIWDLELKRFLLNDERETIRERHTQLKSKLMTIEEGIKAQIVNLDRFCRVHRPEKPEDKSTDKLACVCKYKEGVDPNEVERTYDEKALMEADIEGAEQKMRAIDREVKGERPSAQYPEGIQGINQRIDTYRERQEVVREFIKTL